VKISDQRGDWNEAREWIRVALATALEDEMSRALALNIERRLREAGAEWKTKYEELRRFVEVDMKCVGCDVRKPSPYHCEACGSHVLMGTPSTALECVACGAMLGYQAADMQRAARRESAQWT